jgi:LmbE family N-acetylglucosaminyl deacetylase
MLLCTFRIAALGLATLLGSVVVFSQPRGYSDARGTVGLGLALRRLQTTGILMMATAHPDDENNGLLVELTRGFGIRTALVTATRGDGGQNEIGPELFDALGVLRTAELQTVHRYDGAEQYFTRAVDFGYSFSVQETFQKWGRPEILGDFVRHIRVIRPDVIVALKPEGTGGGQHHEASAQLAGEAFHAAADPAQFPEQLKEGLRPWQAKKLFYLERFQMPGAPPPAGGPGLLTIDTDVWDTLLGATYADIGSEARSNHKSQGMGQLLALPGPSTVVYRPGESVAPSLQFLRPPHPATDPALFAGLDITIPGLAQYAGRNVPDGLARGLEAVRAQAAAAQQAFDRGNLAEVFKSVVAGLLSVRTLRTSLPILGLDPAARAEIDGRLEQKETEFRDAVLEAAALRFDVLADDGEVTGGQPIKVTVSVANRGASPVTVKGVGFTGFDGQANCPAGVIEHTGVYRCESSLAISAQAPFSTPYWHRLPDAARYAFDPGVPFGVPFRPTPFVARIDLELAGVVVPVERPVQYRYSGDIFSGEKRMELQGIPRFSVAVTPAVAIIPSPGPAGAPAERELRVTVVNGERGAARASVALGTPAGWQVTPPIQDVSFAREDEAQTLRVRVRPPSGTRPGAYRLRAFVSADGRRYDRGYQVVEYEHVERHQLVTPAESTVKLVDVTVSPGLTVGYVMGVGDQVPPALEQLGVKVDLLGSDDLAFGDLSRYDAIVTGVRAYERRADLRAHNARLLDYVRNGGTLVVQYNKFEFNEAQYGPYPAKVSDNRVTDENAPVQVLAPANPIFTFPNRIGPGAWEGWVQERGLYFLGEKDPRYEDLVQMEDPFEYNRGVKRGALVEARVGRGRWIYVGLGLWRQLPAGTDGAYQLFANLVSQGKAPQ